MANSISGFNSVSNAGHKERMETVSGLARFPFRFLKWLTDEQIASTTMLRKSAKMPASGFSA
ncbi:MAG: hypothetical protein ACM3XO_19870 [Bacteroidota bacterium]